MGDGGGGGLAAPPPWVMVVLLSHHQDAGATAPRPHLYVAPPRSPRLGFVGGGLPLAWEFDLVVIRASHETAVRLPKFN
jgi:hypothetical protein